MGYGGGKDSSYANSFLRFVQLLLLEEHGLVITGDSEAEQKAYLSWVTSVSRKLSLPRQASTKGVTNFLVQVVAITDRYFRDIYGDLTEEVIARRINTSRGDSAATFFSIYKDTAYRAAGHWPLLTEFLGFQFDEIAFSFTETDCGNPALMAHLRGLKAERVYKRNYEEGVAEYMMFATALMRKKEFPLNGGRFLKTKSRYTKIS